MAAYSKRCRAVRPRLPSFSLDTLSPPPSPSNAHSHCVTVPVTLIATISPPSARVPLRFFRLVQKDRDPYVPPHRASPGPYPLPLLYDLPLLVYSKSRGPSPLRFRLFRTATPNMIPFFSRNYAMPSVANCLSERSSYKKKEILSCNFLLFPIPPLDGMNFPFPKKSP